MKDFTGRVVVVTGAGSGMGRAYALEAAARGARLALNDVSAAELDETRALLPGGTTVLARAFDVASRDEMDAFAAAVATDLGPAFVVINNAGIEGDGQPAWNTPPESYRRVMDINFFGVVNGTLAFLPQLLERDAGAVVNVSSIFGLAGPPNHSDYSASKFAVRGFTEALAAELLHTKVRAYTVHPGGIDTNIARADNTQPFKDKYLTTSSEDIVRVVLDRIGSPRTRVVYGNRAGTTWLGARLLPQRLMNRLTWRDLSPVLDKTAYPAAEFLRRKGARS